MELKQVYAEIDRIASDNRSGAAEILCRAERVFSLLESSNPASHTLDPQEASRIVVEVCASLVRAQPDMAPMARLANAVAAGARSYRLDQTQSPARSLLEQAAHSARTFVEYARGAAASVAAIAAGLIPEGATVLTHSRSSTVLAALVEARRAGRNLSVIATESRPGLEGRTLAEQLAEQDVNVTIIADSAAALIIEEVEMIFFGADRVTPQSLINKIGTRMITLAAIERRLPVYALSDTTKFINQTLGQKRSDEPSGDEIWPDPPHGIKVVNRYFEPTPLDYFTAIITEEGLLAPAEVRKSLESLESLEL